MGYKQSPEYEAARKRYLKNNALTYNDAAYLKALEGGRKAYEQRVLDETTARRNAQWEAQYQPAVDKYKEQMKQNLNRQADVQRARMQAQLGYARSGSYGTSGSWDAANIALDRQYAGMRGDIDQQANMFSLGQYLDFMNREDAQSFSMEQMRQQYQYQMQLMQQQAELNSASWWQNLGGIIGFAAGLPVGGGLTVGGYALGQVI